jgi:Tfp pilus assembly protein PilV
MSIKRSFRRTRRTGLSLFEVVVSAALVGLVLIGAMDCLGAMIRGRMGISHQARGPQLAHQLMTEILNTAYKDGPESGEAGVDRQAFDDVDDFHGWSANPPQQRDGTPVSNSSGWQRDVTVEWVQSDNAKQVVVSDQDLKRITVTVSHNGSVVAQIFALRSAEYLP